MGDCAFSHAHLGTTHSIFIRSSACPAGGSDIKIKRFSGRSGGNINFRNWRLPPNGWRFLGGIAIWLLFPLHSRFGGATGLLRHMVVVRSINGRWDCGMDRPVASLTVYATRLFIYYLYVYRVTRGVYHLIDSFVFQEVGHIIIIQTPIQLRAHIATESNQSTPLEWG